MPPHGQTPFRDTHRDLAFSGAITDRKEQDKNPRKKNKISKHSTINTYTHSKDPLQPSPQSFSNFCVPIARVYIGVTEWRTSNFPSWTCTGRS